MFVWTGLRIPRSEVSRLACRNSFRIFLPDRTATGMIRHHALSKLPVEDASDLGHTISKYVTDGASCQQLTLENTSPWTLAGE